jgi:aspartate ammonia-lyase
VPIDDSYRGLAHAIRRTAAGLETALDPLHGVALGATAVGTGFGAPEGYRARAVAYLGEEVGLALEPAADLFDALAHLDPVLAVADALRRIAVVLGKAAADLRFLSSGPVGGIREVRLPAVQVGSSIMPGKLNPVIPELVLQVSFEVRGACHVVEAAVAAGELELNVMEPVIAKHLLAAIADAGRVARQFADRCIAGIEWDETVLSENLLGSLADVVTLAGEAGYGAASSSLGAAGGATPQGEGNSVIG